jgi:hypothetical protein
MRPYLFFALSLTLIACSEEADPGPEPVTDSGAADIDVQPDSAVDGTDSSSGADASPGGLVYTEERAPCADRDPLKRPLFGDLHVHTRLSFDAWTNDVRTTMDEAYAFAKGEPVRLPPLDADGEPTRTVQLARPLDFVALTDHAEFLAETALCNDPESEAYTSGPCTTFNGQGVLGTAELGILLTMIEPERHPEICGEDGAICREVAMTLWSDVQSAAEAWYDRSSSCELTTFVGYEYSGATELSNYHRNVIFRGAEVPDYPTAYMEAPTEVQLWEALRDTCLEADTGCDVLAIPHNSNWSNGQIFHVEYPQAQSVAEEAEAARLRAAIEPLVEIYQHKGDSECTNGLTSILGGEDELCDFEKLKTKFADCGDEPGFGMMIGLGCVSRMDFVRYVLTEGLREEQRLGVNPYKLGIIASTDTHNGTPGLVEELDFAGHVGIEDDTPEKQLAPIELTPGGILNSPGGLAGVWAEENSRDAIFEALRRRETFGTSGPRIATRFFGGWGYSDDLCADPQLVATGYDGGVPMGGDLPARGDGEGAPRFVVSALRDAGTEVAPGGRLERVQIVKGWIDDDGVPNQAVYDVAVAEDVTGEVDLMTCDPAPGGADTLCSVWTDPGFDPARPAVYYVRVIERPSCRYSWRRCLAIPEADRPPTCSAQTIPKTVHERAWTSPIWYTPES